MPYYVEAFEEQRMVLKSRPFSTEDEARDEARLWSHHVRNGYWRSQIRAYDPTSIRIIKVLAVAKPELEWKDY
jgi:hypothetical protein